MGSFSLMHWLVVGIIAILLLGGGRFSNMMGDVAKGIKSFKKGMADDEDVGTKTLDHRADEPMAPTGKDKVGKTSS